MRLKLWLISQTKNTNYDSYDSAVVAAMSADAARQIHPGPYGAEFGLADWAAPEFVSAKLIGEAAEGIAPGEVICASFNAG